MRHGLALPIVLALSLTISAFGGRYLTADAPPAVVAAPADAQHPTTDKRPAVNLYKLTIRELYDADTITDCDIELGYGVTLTEQRVRLCGFDAAEISRHRRTARVTDAEIALGKQAVAELGELIEGGVPYLAPPSPGTPGDPYGRRQGFLYVLRFGRWTSVALWAREKGFDRDAN